MKTCLASCFVSLVLASCSVDFDSSSCGELAREFRARVDDVDRSCNVASDCVLLGGVLSNQFCDGYPALSERIGGEPVSSTGYAHDGNHAELAAIIANWGERCAGRREICNTPDGVSCDYDSAQYPVTCSDHVCAAVGGSCIGGPDAGNVDAGDADAGADAGP